MVTAIIPEHRIEFLEAKLNDLNKKANKLGCSPIKITSQFDHVLYEHNTPDGPDYRKEKGPHATGVTLRMFKVELDGETPKYAGWRFVAALYITEKGNIINTVPGYEQLLVQYKDFTNVCQHCNTKRNRKETFVLEHEDGRQMVVGRSCIKDFLGHASPSDLLSWASLMFEVTGLLDADEEELFKYPREKMTFDLELWLTKACAEIRENGFISKKMGDEKNIVPTAFIVYNCFTTYVDDNKIEHLPEDEEKAKAVVEWMKAIPADASNFYSNIRVIAELGYVEFKTTGIATYAVQGYTDWYVQKIAKPATASKPVGVKDQRIALKGVRVLRTHVYESSFCDGFKCIHTMQDAEGNTLVWFASAGGTWLEAGQVYDIKATVKDHKIYRDEMQTVVNRVAATQEPVLRDAVV